MIALNGIFWVAILAVAAVLVWRFVARWANGSESGHDLPEKRYARGEIQREEYLQKRQDIHGAGVP
jgi:uncharacterized membrane protein